MQKLIPHHHAALMTGAVVNAAVALAMDHAGFQALQQHAEASPELRKLAALLIELRGAVSPIAAASMPAPQPRARKPEYADAVDGYRLGA